MAAETKSVRIAKELVADAAAVASQLDRSAAEQVTHWARVGKHVSMARSINTRKVLAVSEGRSQFSSLTAEEREIAHAMVDAEIDRRSHEARFGLRARETGVATVAMDDEGRLVRTDADGTTTIL